MNIIFGIIVGILILMLLVLAHEFGHFIFARRNGVTVKEFGIGFPPRAIAFIRKSVVVVDKKTGKEVKKERWVRLPKSEWNKPQDTLILSINWLPIGGFCSMDDGSDTDSRKGTFDAASFWAKTKILFGGVLMNFLTACVILTILAWTGMPHFINNQFTIKSDQHIASQGGAVIVDVLADSPAEKAGIKPGDIITHINDGSSENWQNEVSNLFVDDIISYNDAHRGETAEYAIVRDGESSVYSVQLNASDSEYALGVSFGYSESLTRYTWSAPLIGIGSTIQFTGETFKSLGQLIWNLCTGVVRQFSPDDTVREEGKEAIGTVGDSVSGPVGIIGVLFPAFVEAGPTNLAFFAAIISVSLACMNLLPIPALDGGRWLLIAYFRLRGKKLTKEIEERIVSRAFMILLALIGIITILDIIKLF